LLNAHAARLSEHFDAVVIMASYMEPDGTWTAVSEGEGNFFARLGMAAQFVESTKAESLAQELLRREDDDE
jgi:hypothetical protein